MTTLEDNFNDWYNTIGVRTYSKDHGSAQGHQDYAKNAFLGGYYAGLECFKNLLSEDDQTEIHNN